MTRYGHYEFMVVTFGLSNAPTIFMCMMNGVFRKYLDKFAIMFLNYILIYSKSEEENEFFLIMVLQVLREHKSYAKLSKCIFYQKKIHYLVLALKVTLSLLKCKLNTHQNVKDNFGFE
jgi:hypothetical protein